MTNALTVNESSETSITTLLFNSTAMAALITFGEMMSKSAVTVPKHLQGKPADCTAIAMQAAQWRMNPFAVAQKTHISQSGALGYEGQLINAVITTSGALQDRPDFEFLGDWGRILGKVKEERGQNGGKYYVATWDKADEEGLGVIVTATIRGEREKRSVTVMMTQAYPRFSTQWATDPQQQITFLAVRKFARRYVPDAILGVYTVDELPGFDTFDNDTGAPVTAAAPAAKVARKPKAEQAADVTDVTAKGEAPAAPAPAAAAAPPAPVGAPAPMFNDDDGAAPAAAPAATGGDFVGLGEIAFLRNKAKSLGVELSDVLKTCGGLILERLAKADFDAVKVELRRLEG
jgi:hypothetical protein